MTLPQVGSEDGVERSGYHHEHGARTEDTGREQEELVEHEQVADVVVAVHGALEGRQKVDTVHHGRRSPATPLVVELVECLGGVREGVGRGRVLDSVTLLQHQRAQPSVLSCNENGYTNVQLSFAIPL